MFKNDPPFSKGRIINRKDFPLDYSNFLFNPLQNSLTFQAQQ